MFGRVIETFSSVEGISLIAQRLGSAIPEIVSSLLNFVPISGISFAASGVSLINISGSQDRQADSFDWDFRCTCLYGLSVGGGHFRGDVFFQAKFEGTALVLTDKRPPRPFKMSVGYLADAKTFANISTNSMYPCISSSFPDPLEKIQFFVLLVQHGFFVYTMVHSSGYSTSRPSLLWLPIKPHFRVHGSSLNRASAIYE